MKYLITVAILCFLCINANAQVTASNDEKASGAAFGQYRGYSYEVTYTNVNGKVLQAKGYSYEVAYINVNGKVIKSVTGKSGYDKSNTLGLNPSVRTLQSTKPALKDENYSKKYSYEVNYKIANGNILQPDTD